MKLTIAFSTLSTIIVTLAQPAYAIIYDWQFTNEEGNIGLPTDILKGEVEFDDSKIFPNISNIAADRLTITEVTGVNSSTPPLFGDGGIELNIDLVALCGCSLNAFDFDENENLVEADFVLTTNVGGDEEIFRLVGSSTLWSFSTNEQYLDTNSNTLEFTKQSASVPFEFSPALGLLAVGSFLAGSHWFKRRKFLTK